MRILSRQFLTSYLRLYAASLVASLAILVVIEMMLNFEDAVEFSGGVGGVASYLFLRIPSYYLPYLIPVCSFAAALLCLGLPARTREILAMRASGLRPQRACIPVLLAAAAISGLGLVLNETLVLDTAQTLESRERGGLESPIFRQQGSIWVRRGAYLFNVEEADPVARTLRGVRIYERNPAGHLIRSTEAHAGHVDEGDQWHLRDAVVRRFDPANPAAALEVVFHPELTFAAGTERELALLNADANTLPLAELSQYIDALEADGRDPSRFRAMFHSRLADPLSVLLFALLGIPIGLTVERSRSLAAAAVQGIGVLGIFYTFQTVGSLTASNGWGLAVYFPWFVLAGFAAFGAWRFSRTAL